MVVSLKALIRSCIDERKLIFENTFPCKWFKARMFFSDFPFQNVQPKVIEKVKCRTSFLSPDTTANDYSENANGYKNSEKIIFQFFLVVSG